MVASSEPKNSSSTQMFEVILIRVLGGRSANASALIDLIKFNPVMGLNGIVSETIYQELKFLTQINFNYRIESFQRFAVD